MSNGGLVGRIRATVRGRGLDLVRYPLSGTLPWALEGILPRLGTNCVIDVGGHKGEYGLLLRRAGFTGHIVSFEPLAENFAILERRCAADAKWSAFPVALGREEGSLPINVTAATDFASLLQPDATAVGEYADAMRVTRVEQVAIHRLDGYLAELDRSIPSLNLFIKSDTQGYDLEVLEGAGDFLPRVRGIQLELPVMSLYHGMRGFTASLDALTGMGFQLFGLYPVNFEAATRRTIEFDCVMTRS